MKEATTQTKTSEQKTQDLLSEHLASMTDQMLTGVITGSPGDSLGNSHKANWHTGTVYPKYTDNTDYNQYVYTPKPWENNPWGFTTTKTTGPSIEDLLKEHGTSINIKGPNGKTRTIDFEMIDKLMALLEAIENLDDDNPLKQMFNLTLMQKNIINED